MDSNGIGQPIMSVEQVLAVTAKASNVLSTKNHVIEGIKAPAAPSNNDATLPKITTFFLPNLKYNSPRCYLKYCNSEICEKILRMMSYLSERGPNIKKPII